MGPADVNVSERHVWSLLLHKNIFLLENFRENASKRSFFVYSTLALKDTLPANAASRAETNVMLTARNYVCYCTCYWWWHQFLCRSRNAYGVKVPSTSSLSVYTKVLAHNLNDIRNWASLIGLLLRTCWCLLSVFLIYCSDEWEKLVNLIYCFQVLFRMNF